MEIKPVEEKSAPQSVPRGPAGPASNRTGHRRQGWPRWLLPVVLVGLIAIAGGGYWIFVQNGATAEASPRDIGANSKPKFNASVEVVTPRPGGLPRTSTQPGTVHAYESAKLYAKISGYLDKLNVDYGDEVKQGQVLVEIDDPEAHKAVDQAQAMLAQAKAQVAQAEARIASSKADYEAANAAVAKAVADVGQFRATRVYRKSELDRITVLARQNSVERKLVDEEQERYLSSVASENAAEANIRLTKAQASAAEAKIQQAEADKLDAEANVMVSQANLETAQVIAGYTQIVAPYDGVITELNFYRGAFIRSAVEGGDQPILAIARTDKVRVVVQVPDRDVPLVNQGDDAVVRINALPGKEFHAVVSRFADSENPLDRTMHTEIDLENSKGMLREGMYGNVTIILEPPQSDAMTLPASSLIEQNGQGNGAVYIVSDGKVHRRAIRVGKDNGNEVEVLSGLQPDDQVVFRYNGSLSEGLEVDVEPAVLVPTDSSEPQLANETGSKNAPAE